LTAAHLGAAVLGRFLLDAQERTSRSEGDTSEKCHVWTAPAVQEESDISAKRSGAAMYPAFDAAAMAAGPDVIR